MTRVSREQAAAALAEWNRRKANARARNALIEQAQRDRNVEEAQRLRAAIADGREPFCTRCGMRDHYIDTCPREA